MPSFEITAPDGRKYAIDAPEGATQEQALEHFKANWKPETDTSALKRFGQGLLEPVEGLGQIAAQGIAAAAPNTEAGRFAQQHLEFGKQQRLAQEAANQAANVGTNYAGMAGNVLSPVNLMTGAAMKGAPLISQGVRGGAVSGLLSPNNAEDNFAEEKAKQIGMGALTGAATGLGSDLATGFIKGATPSKYVELLRKEGVTPTAGQILGGAWQRAENKLESIPILGDFITKGHKEGYEEYNKAILNRALKPIGETTDKVGREGVQEVESKLNQYYDKILPELGFLPDDEFVQKMSTIKQMVGQLPRNEQKSYANIMQRIESQASPNGGMVGETFKEVESLLNTEAKRFGKSTDAYQQSLGDALSETLKTYREVLPRSNPNYADELTKANTGWANYARIRDAANRTAAGANEGIFSPAQLAQAVRSQDKTVGKGASAKGKALMQDIAEAGTNVLSPKYPDSGTAGRAALDLAVGGAGYAFNPLIPAGLAAAGLPFVGAGRKATGNLLLNRPEEARKLADILRQGAAYGVTASPYMVNQ